MTRLPAHSRIPCRGCRYLGPVGKEHDVSDFYMRCGFESPVSAYWMSDGHEMTRWRNLSHIHGPFAADVKDVVCTAREEA